MKYFSLKVMCILVALAFTLVGCSNSTNSTEGVLEGHWMDEYGNTVTFIGDGSVMWYGSNYSYSIYDTNKVIVKNGDSQVGNYAFNVKSETLELKDLDYQTETVFYGSMDKQEKILEELREAELAQMEADAKAEQEYYDSIITYERESELELLTAYKAQCIENLNQTANEEDKLFYQSEIDAIQERIDVLETKDENEISRHSFEKACDWIWNFCLPEAVANSDDLIYEDFGVQFIDIMNDGSTMMGHMVRVRTSTEDILASIYGDYIVQFSTTNIYKYSMLFDTWEFVCSLNLIEN